MKTFRDYKGCQQPAPAERKHRVAAHGANDVINWSRGSMKHHRVNYGLQSTEFTSDLDAAVEFGYCVRHYAECEGLLA